MTILWQSRVLSTGYVLLMLNLSLAMSHLWNWWHWTRHWPCHTYETGDTEIVIGHATLMKLVILKSSLAMSHLWNWWRWTCDWLCHTYETGDTELVIGYVKFMNLIYIGYACSGEASQGDEEWQLSDLFWWGRHVGESDLYWTCSDEGNKLTKQDDLYWTCPLEVNALTKQGDLYWSCSSEVNTQTKQGNLYLMCSDEVNKLTNQGLNWMHVLMRWTH